MKSSEKFSTTISNFINKTLHDKTEEELEIIRYGIEVLLQEYMLERVTLVFFVR